MNIIDIEKDEKYKEIDMIYLGINGIFYETYCFAHYPELNNTNNTDVWIKCSKNWLRELIEEERITLAGCIGNDKPIINNIEYIPGFLNWNDSHYLEIKDASSQIIKWKRDQWLVRDKGVLTVYKDNYKFTETFIDEYRKQLTAQSN